MADTLKYVSAKSFQELAKGKSAADLQNIVVMKSFAAEVKAVDIENRQIDFSISTADVDRDNDTIAIDGWEFGNWLKNPAVLFAHDHWQPPVARGLNVSIDGVAVRSRAEFTPAELYPFGFMIFRFYAEGYMKAVSVGFKPAEWTYDESRKYGVNYLRQELLEYSCVPIPSNPNALVEARGKGIDTNPLKIWCERLLDDARLAKGEGVTRDTLERVRALASPSGKALILEVEGLKMDEPTPADKQEPAAKETPAATAEEKQPAKASAVKRVETWACGADGCTHESEEAAQKCVEDTAAIDAAVTLIAEKADKLKPEAKAKLAPAVKDAPEPKADEGAKDDEKNESVGENDAKFFEFDTDPDELPVKGDELKALIADGIRSVVDQHLKTATGKVE